MLREQVSRKQLSMTDLVISNSWCAPRATGAAGPDRFGNTPFGELPGK
ncbi:hypothetical protein [Flavilitoribacter nigricans]|nr:hypothetical protein [Flavilitoribacter nigricans]